MGKGREETGGNIPCALPHTVCSRRPARGRIYPWCSSASSPASYRHPSSACLYPHPHLQPLQGSVCTDTRSSPCIPSASHEPPSPYHNPRLCGISMLLKDMHRRATYRNCAVQRLETQRSPNVRAQGKHWCGTLETDAVEWQVVRVSMSSSCHFGNVPSYMTDSCTRILVSLTKFSRSRICSYLRYSSATRVLMSDSLMISCRERSICGTTEINKGPKERHYAYLFVVVRR